MARAADEAPNSRPAAHFALGLPSASSPCWAVSHPRKRLRQMTDEAMYILAAMLPEGRRGYYSDLSKATRETIEWG